MQWEIILVLVFMSVPVSIIAFFAVKFFAAKRLSLKAEMNSEQGFVSTDSHEELIGSVAIAQTVLRPAGIILINGKRLDAQTDGEYVKKGTNVKVIQTNGAQLIVESIEG